ncbi:MAG: hypothetical protein Q9181_006428 [Wetmoreana brouardii]
MQTSTDGGNMGPSSQGSNTMSSPQGSSIPLSSRDRGTGSSTQDGNTFLSSQGSRIRTTSFGSSNRTPSQGSGAATTPRRSGTGAPSQNNTDSKSQTSSGAAPSPSLNSPSPSQNLDSGSSLGASSTTRNTDNRTISSHVASPISRAGTSKLSAVTPPSTLEGSNPTDRQPTPPITAALIATIPPTGTEAKSSASSLSSQIVIIAAVWQDFIDYPDKDKGDDLINKIKDLEDDAEVWAILVPSLLQVIRLTSDKGFEIRIGLPPSGTNSDCSVSTNLIKYIFNAAKCVMDNLKKAENDIEAAIKNNFGDLSKVKTRLENVKGLEEILKEDREDDDDNSYSKKHDQPSQSFGWPSSQTSSPTPSRTSSQASCVITQTGTSSKSATGSSATTPAVGSGNTAPTPAKYTTNSRARTHTGTLFGTGSSNTVTTTFASSTTSAALAQSSTLSCASSSSVPTSVPESAVQKDIKGWCSGELNLFGPSTNCDNVDRDGFWLSNICTPKTNPYFQQFYFPGTTVYLKVSLVQGTEEYLANSTTCESALGEVLNGCPPLSEDPLVNYGGGAIRDDGTGKKALWQILLTPVEPIS